MRWILKVLNLFVGYLVASFFITGFSFVCAQDESVDVSVKIHLCGDLIVEPPPEDCEWLDLNGESCESLGFQSGDLFCDISCHFDTSFCIPFPVPACGDGTLDAGEECEIGNPAGSLCDWSECNNTICTCGEEPEEPEEPEPEPEPELEPEPKPKPKSPLDYYEEAYITPEELARYVPGGVLDYDLNGDGKITNDELERIIEFWTSIWRGIVIEEEFDGDCDLNGDGECDVIDFSILMYYFEL